MAVPDDFNALMILSRRRDAVTLSHPLTAACTVKLLFLGTLRVMRGITQRDPLSKGAAGRLVIPAHTADHNKHLKLSHASQRRCDDALGGQKRLKNGRVISYS